MDFFWSKVDRSGGSEACWPWLASKNNGYGCAWSPSEKRVRKAHQVALETREPRPSPLAFACHHCDNRACCNPSHLYWGNHHTNAADRARRGRSGKEKRGGLANDNAENLRGHRFGFLLAIRPMPFQHRSRHQTGIRWWCVCDCGIACVKRATYLLKGETKTCGSYECRMLLHRAKKPARGRDTPEGRVLSRNRMGLAVRLVRDVPVPTETL